MITSARSASASEVVINSLKPYMNVKLIGDVTVGKDAGSITLYEDDNPDNLWAIQPIIVKLVNSAGEDYPNGFTPDVEKVEDFLVLQPLGSIDEPLLSIALALASGGQPARVDLAEYGSHYQELGRKEIFSSVDHKAYSGKFLLNK